MKLKICMVSLKVFLVLVYAYKGFCTANTSHGTGKGRVGRGGAAATQGKIEYSDQGKEGDLGWTTEMCAGWTMGDSDERSMRWPTHYRIM